MEDKLKEIEIENYIIYIYFIILIIYLYANNIEIDYIRTGNNEDKEKYRLLLYIVFGTTFIITLFYSIESLKDLNNTNEYVDPPNEVPIYYNDCFFTFFVPDEHKLYCIEKKV